MFKFAPVGSLGPHLAFGFHAARSHSIVDMRECLIVTPEIFELVQALRSRLASLLDRPGEMHVTQTLTGFDLAFRSSMRASAQLGEKLARAVAELAVARIVFNGTLLMETAAPQVAFGAVRVKLPPHGFLQPTKTGEVALQSHVGKILARAKHIADLFCGCGTFSLPLAKAARVYAIDEDRAMTAALIEAAKTHGQQGLGLKPIAVERRDLFKLPMQAAELERFDGLVLDPPRAGAQAQIQVLARSQVPSIAYVSCNPSSFARDAAILTKAGYSLGLVTPIDQFLWSSHIELVAGFSRGRH